MEIVDKGAIIFDKYRVKKIEFELNEFYNEEEVDICLEVSANFNVSEDKTSLTVEMVFNIFKDAIKMHYPFEMELIIKGYFSINPEDEGNIDKYQGNAMAILYPYARALVSTYTANANVSPLILPTININKYLSKRN